MRNSTRVFTRSRLNWYWDIPPVLRPAGAHILAIIATKVVTIVGIAS